MKTVREIRVGFIGTGGMAQVHAEQLLELENVEIKSIADISETARNQFIVRNDLQRVEQFTDYQDMLEQVELDGVVICSPHTLHFEQATAVLEKGLHVLIEKPMTCSSKEARQLMETANRTGKMMQVSYQRHFQPEFIYIHDIIQSGKLGKVTSITASLYQQWWRGRQDKYVWRQDPKLSGGGFLMDSGSHIIDVLLWTTGLTPIEISTKLSQQGAPVEIDTFTSIRFKEGAIAGLNLVGYAPIWHETYVFCGEKGALFYDNDQIKVYLSNGEMIIPELPKQTTNQDKSFIDAILGKHEVKVPGDFALKVVEFSEMVYKSAGYKPYEIDEE